MRQSLDHQNDIRWIVKSGGQPGYLLYGWNKVFGWQFRAPVPSQEDRDIIEELGPYLSLDLPAKPRQTVFWLSMINITKAAQYRGRAQALKL